MKNYDKGTPMLTTHDNPYNPFKQFVDWYTYDMLAGYNSSGYLARIAMTSEQLTEDENIQTIEDAIDEIIKYDFMNIYKKVYSEDFDNVNNN